MKLFKLSIIILLISCNLDNKKKDLSYYNIPIKNPFIANIDTQKTNIDTVCFHIRHQNNINLSIYKLILGYGGKVVFNNYFQKEIVVNTFPKVKDASTFFCMLYNPSDSIGYYWENKDVYEFKKCKTYYYNISLFSEKNKDHSDGNEMEISEKKQ